MSIPPRRLFNWQSLCSLQHLCDDDLAICTSIVRAGLRRDEKRSQESLDLLPSLVFCLLHSEAHAGLEPASNVG
jgi:hypothetical protein